jgi:hypothetical protein
VGKIRKNRNARGEGGGSSWLGMGRAFAAFSPQRALICTRMVPQLDLEVEAYCRYDDTDGGDKGRRIHLFITGQQ